jgi:serine/threonine protein kinase
MTLERGTLLNKRYRIVEILGQGGMAAVYRAIDENLGVEVAVKENLFTTDEYARQFRLEATILANLRHPNLPRVSDHFVIDLQGQYLVMDYIEGEDLRQRLDRLGPLPEQEVIIIGVAISDAMAYMHSRKPMVLHRDIKPGNVRITSLGHIYLVDFGLAKIVQGREATSTGARAMTPGYSPPEQYGTARTDQRSDIYSLGATLYSALTDELPEDGLARAMDQAVLTPVTDYTPKISRKMAGILEKCLEVRPDNRYQSADELRRDLLEARSTTRRRAPIELVLTPPPVTLERNLPEDEQDIPSQEGEESPVAEDELEGEIPDRGKKWSKSKYVRREEKYRAGFWALFVFLLFLLGIAATAIIDPRLTNQAMARFLPTGTMTMTAPLPTEIVSTTTPLPDISLPSATMATPTVTNSPTLAPPTNTPRPTATKTIAPTATLIGGGLSQILFASDRTGSPEIYLMNLDGSGLTQLTDIAEGACQGHFSPDGEKIVFISPCPKDQLYYPGASLFIMNADGSEIIPLPNVPGGDFDPSWSPNGKQIAFTSLREEGIAKIFLINLDDYSVTPLGEEGNKASSQPSWSPDGKQLAYVGSDNRIWAIDLTSGERHGLTIGGGDFESSEPSWSPDGTAVVFVRRRVNDDTATNWMMAVPYTTSGALAVEVPNSSLVSLPNYSPDGFWLTFKSWAAGNQDIYIMRPSGVDKQIVVSDLAYDFDSTWRPYLLQP